MSEAPHPDLPAGIESLRRGNLPEAERRFLQVAGSSPAGVDRARALHQLGLIYHRRGESQRAAKTLREAATGLPGDAEVRAHLAEVLRTCGEIEAAIASGREALELDPRSAPAANNLALALLESGDAAAAEAVLRACVERHPTYAKAQCNLGKALHDQARPHEAEAALRAAIALQPRYPKALNLLGAVVGELGRHEEAVSLLEQASRQDPRYPKPLNNLGHLLLSQERFDGALRCFEAALRLDTHYLDAASGLSEALQGLDRNPDAIERLRRLVRELPDSARAHALLGAACFSARRYAQAVASYSRALERDDTDKVARATRALARVYLCQWQGRDEEHRRVRDETLACLEAGEPSPLNPFSAMFFPFEAREHLAIARAAAKLMVKKSERLRARLDAEHPWRPEGSRSVVATPGASVGAHSGAVSGASKGNGASGRLRLGYFSSDLRHNAVGHLTRSLFGLHDRERFEVFAYSTGPDDSSVFRRDIAAGCDKFYDLRRASDLDVAARMRDDGIHLAVDLVGFTGGGRPEILALRPAPLQVSWLYPGTMGGVFHDYLVGDSVVLPEGADSEVGEAAVRLAGSYLIYDHAAEVAPGPVTRAAAGLPDQGFVFCSFNTSKKFEPRIWDVWMRLLREVPGSVLWLADLDREYREALAVEATARGVASERLVLAPQLSLDRHLARCALGDLFLDTPLYNAHTTAAHSLFAGVPVLTVSSGACFHTRVAHSLVSAVGLPELAVPDLERYEVRALELARDPDQLQDLRRRLEQNRRNMPPFDGPAFVRRVEGAYLEMWRRHSSGALPSPFAVGLDGTVEPEPGAKPTGAPSVHAVEAAGARAGAEGGPK